MRYDLNHDGMITFRELYEAMLKRMPDEWLEWIAKKYAFISLKFSLEIGIKEEFLIEVFCCIAQLGDI